MNENLHWLWYAFSAGWMIHIVYLLSISSRAKKLSEQMDYLKTLLQEHENKAGRA